MGRVRVLLVTKRPIIFLPTQPSLMCYKRKIRYISASPYLRSLRYLGENNLALDQCEERRSDYTAQQVK